MNKGSLVFRVSLLAVVLVILSAVSSAQVPSLEPNRPESPPIPIVIFDYVWNSAQPPHYAIAVESTGNAAYRANDAPEKGEVPGDPYILKFIVSQPTRSQIFDLAKQANYFKGDFDYTKTRIAQTGVKTLTYMEGHLVESFDYRTQGHENITSYNWSENPAIQQLTTIFQDISNTIELGRRLDFKRRFDKLGLDAELKSAEEQQKSGNLAQMQAIAPILKKIANDVSVMNIARERAKRLLAVAAAETQGASQTAP